MLQLTSGPYKMETDAPAGGPSGWNTGFADFRSEFQILHERAPLRAIKLFVHYLSARGADAIARQMALWATSGTLYISVLLDNDAQSADGIPAEVAANAVFLLPSLDNEFLLKLARIVAGLTEPAALLRAMQLIPALGDYSILIPWLRSLETQADSRVRSRAAKLLCQLRPSDGLIRHHLQSRDARVRASVLEALWNPKIIRVDHTVLAHLRSGVTDPNHRVVANALVGLYRLGDGAALEKMISLCTTKPHLLRAAMAWAMGAVEDSRAVASLQRLMRDPSYTVRKRASSSLLALGFAPEDENGGHRRLVGVDGS